MRSEIPRKYYLFTDVSINNDTKKGYGAYVYVSAENLKEECFSMSEVNSICLPDTSSTKMELDILLFALRTVNVSFDELVICSDSQNIIGLPGRRTRLEENNYQSNSGNIIANKDLYKEFFEYLDNYNLTFVKVKGHSASKFKDSIAKCFTLVDKHSRKAMRSSR